MSFRIEKPQANFTIVCNAILRDARLSLRAKGLYALMVSKPEGWVFHEKAMLKEFTEGRDALRGAFKELLGASWLSKVQPRENGKFDSNVYRIHSTADWKTVDGETDDGKTATSNTDRSKTDRVSTRAQRLEAFLEGKVCNGAGCPLGWWQWTLDEFKWDTLRIKTVWDTFCDHWKATPGQKGVKADWEATWHNWCRRESSFAKPSKSGDVRVRETTAEEKTEAAHNRHYLAFLKNGQDEKTAARLATEAVEREIAALARDALGAA